MKKAGFWRRWVALVIDLFLSLGFLLIVYETILLSQWNGYTIGKKIMGIKVVRTDGKTPDWIHAFVRSISRWLSALPLELGYFWMLWDKDSQTWHDKLADTYVVEA